jgi:hypothetical protein
MACLVLRRSGVLDRVSVEICSRTFSYPTECPCCGADPDAELPIALRASSRTLSEHSATRILFPYCSQCVEHVATWEAGSSTMAVVVLLGVFGGGVLAMSGSALHGGVVCGAALLVAVMITSIIRSRARAMCSSSCAHAGQSVIYYGWSGSTSTFAFASPTYTARFGEHNAADLVSVDDKLQKLLDAHEVARRQVTTSASPTRTVPLPFEPLAWLESVERQPSTVARRMVLTRALQVIQAASDREMLAEAVARAELAHVFERLANLPPYAKQRELRRVRAEIRADNLPDELRAVELRMLDATQK